MDPNTGHAQEEILPRSPAGKTGLLGVTHAEGRARATSRLNARIAHIKAHLPKSAIQIVETCPVRYRPLLAQTLVGDANKTEAIKAQCQQCVGWEEVMDRVRECNSRACGLWHHRPYQTTKKARGETQ